jgi:predicted aspartyl protease
LPALLASCLCAQTPKPESTPAAQTTPQKVTCNIDRTPPSDGDIALAKTNYDAALTYFRDAVAKDAGSQDARLGLVRALIGKDQTAEAIKEAAAFLALQPRSAVAEVAAGEAAYRAADLEDMRAHILKALDYDRCEGRVLALAANLYSLHARFGTEASLLADAHRLRPNDEFIRRDWIGSLPRKQRQAELTKYLGETKALSEKDRAGYINEEDHLKASRPGECHITAKSENVTIPFTALYGDSNHPTSFGLEVAYNGKKRRMQIDTGASGILLTHSAARGLGLEPEYRLHTGGVGDDGEVDSFLTHVANIQIGDVQISDCMVEVLSGKSKLDVDGLIGIDVFRRWLATLDYPNQKLLLSPLPPRPVPPALASLSEDERPPQDAISPPEMKDWLHIVRIGHEILLPSFVNKGAFHYMMADTGASMSTLSLAYAKESGKVHSQDDVQFRGISGAVKKTYYIDNVGLQFGQLRIPPTSYYAFDLTSVSHNTGVEVSGFVGLPTLSRLTISIDYRDNLMQLKYDPKHDVQRF